MLVGDFMERDVLTLHAGDFLNVADDVMRLRRVRHMPVLERGELTGILSQRDLFRAAASTAMGTREAESRDWLARVRVGDVMTRDVVTIDPDETVRHAAELMLIRRIGCLPVVDNGRMVGLLSETDCLRVLTAVLAYREGVAYATRAESMVEQVQAI